MPWPFRSRLERIRREAADWMALLHGPCDEEERAAFESWYRSDPEHARAYDRAAAWFEVARGAERPRQASAGVPTEKGLRTRPIGWGLAAVACAAVLAFIFLSARTMSPVPGLPEQFAAFSAETGASRRIVLSDGSEVLLSPGSSVEVAIGGRERRLRLVRGEGRFSVAREARPFIVAADGTEVVARGTQFVVRMRDGRTTVSLIEGRVDVAHAPSPGRIGQRRVTRLEPGEQIVVEAEAPRARPPVAHAPSQARPAQSAARMPQPAMLQFDDTRLADAVEQANRHSGVQIRLAEPALANLRVTGAFRTGDVSGFAQAVAAAFDLEVRRTQAGILSLHKSRGDSGSD